MGCFSWMFSNTINRRLKIGKPGFLLLPDGEYIKEESYDGYGIFGGKDVFDLVAEWNRDSLSEEMLILPKYEKYGDENSYKRAMQRYASSVCRLYDYKSRKYSDDEMEEKYGKNWKREIGIDISCYDEQNASLPFPIKITSSIKDYNKVPASNGDPDQGL